MSECLDCEGRYCKQEGESIRVFMQDHDFWMPMKTIQQCRDERRESIEEIPMFPGLLQSDSI